MKEDSVAEIFEAIGTCIVAVDESTNIIAFNDAAVKIFARPRNGALGRPIAELFSDEYRRSLSAGIEAAFACEPHETLETCISSPDDAATNVAWSFAGVRGQGGGEGNRVCVMTGIDVTELRRVEQVARDSGRILETTSVAVIIVNRDLVIQGCNPAAEVLYGYSEDELIGQPNTILAPADLRNTVGKAAQTILATGKPHLRETQRVHKDGTVIDVDLRVSPLRNRFGEVIGYASISFDISERKSLEAELTHMALSDPLTGLSNRRHFLEVAEIEIARNRRYNRQMSLVLCDLDHFKSINDRWGHAAGDEVLKHFADIGRGQLRENLDCFGRLGGEEFGILMPETGCDEAVQVAERLREALAASQIVHAGETITATASFGAASWLKSDNSIDAALHRADEALYLAKAGGRNCVHLAAA